MGIHNTKYPTFLFLVNRRRHTLCFLNQHATLRSDFQYVPGSQVLISRTFKDLTNFPLFFMALNIQEINSRTFKDFPGSEATLRCCAPVCVSLTLV